MLLVFMTVVATGCKKTPSNGFENGHEWVDLGLSSGLLWATCNIGAATPEAYGDYFAWGETTAKETYNWSTYKYYDGNNVTKYTGSDNLEVLEAFDDAAHVNWGGAWRMPTADEMRELRDNCTHKWTTQNGVNGHLFTGANGNSLFLPAAGSRYEGEISGAGSYGYYWSSSLGTGNPYYAWRFGFSSEGFGMYSSYYRIYGFTVRPVCLAQN